MSQKEVYMEGDRDFDILHETRDLVAKMTQSQRFKKARRHLDDALSFRQARNDPDTNDSWLFWLAYNVQTSSLWNNFLFILSIVYMYLIAAEPNNRLDLGVPLNQTAYALDISILAILSIDIVFEVLHKVSWNASFSKKYPFRFWAKVFLVALFIIDSIVFYTKYTTFPLRPFRILRAFLPYFYDYFSRKALHSLYSAGKDILVYLIFYTIVILAFSVVATQIIDLPPGTPFDRFNSNYHDLGTMSFLIYVLASYDAWPDYEILAVTSGSKWYYVFFVAFIFLNCFYFVTIPTTVIFASFKSSRSKLVLIDEIKQQNSLLLCFVTLGQRNLTIKSQTFHQFMLYVYKYKLRLIDHIKQLSYKLDPNNNSIIFVSDFMRLCKLMQQDSHMLPPRFADFTAFYRCRKWLCRKLYLKRIATSDAFDIVVILVIIINFIVIMVSFFQHVDGYETIEIVLLAFYCVELVVRFIGEGPEKFLDDERNWVDAGLLFVSLALMGDNSETNLTLRKVARLIRLFRINRVVRIFWRNEFFRKRIYLSSLYQRLRLLFNQLYICSIVGLRMFPLFMTVFYVLSVIGMQRFDNRFGVPSSSPYSLYDKVSSFRNLVQANLIMVQVMIQAGWSPIVYDYADRYKSFAQVAIFFVAIHVCIVIIMVSLMKGMAADFYETIYNRYQEILDYELGLLEEERREEEKRVEFEEIREAFMAGRELTQDTVKKKEIKETKQNREMIQALKNMMREKMMKSPMKRNKSLRAVIISHTGSAKDIYKQRKMQQMTPEINPSFVTESQIQIQGNVNLRSEEVLEDKDLISLCDEDIEELEDDFVDKIALKDQMPFSTTPFYPTFLKQFLKRTMIPINRRKLQPEHDEMFNLNKDKVGDSVSITSFYTMALENLLHIEKPQQQRKKEILQDILKLKITNQAEIARRVAKKYKHQKRVEIDQIIKRVYLSNTNEKLVQKFQIQYFSDIYGNTFKQMNRVTIEPILRHQALLLDTMSKVLRYPQIQTADFFHLLATIEYKISNSLVKKGSIFKFVFEVEELGDNWFAIEVKENKELRLHFLKTSIWIYGKETMPDEIYYGHDIFWFNKDEYPGYDYESNVRIIKLLYGAFESLAFSMLNQTNFFKSDPAECIYDVYSLVIPCDKSEKHLLPPSKSQFNLKISRVMLVILSKQNDRPKDKKLEYSLTNLKQILEQKKKKKTTADFKFDEDENSTFEKLKNLAAEDEQKIAESEGLPFCFLVDMIKSVQNILSLHKNTLIEKAQQVLNQEFNKQFKVEKASESYIGSGSDLL